MEPVETGSDFEVSLKDDVLVSRTFDMLRDVWNEQELGRGRS